MRLRRLEREDHDTVRRTLLAAYAAQLAVEPSYAASLTDLERRDREAEVWVADDEDLGVVGTVTICPPGSSYREVARDGELEFRMLAVTPAAQGRGVGRALTGLVLDEARRRGLTTVVLCSTTAMTAAHRLYERLGFVRDPDRDWSPHPTVDLIAYRLELT